ncbi:phytoene desaturase family protein [Sulfurimonas marina]|uniref:Phytoene dehydrogenase n=1 Tax=Sulfurimonas marina TaxID=2590551 RepID=A0A7M3V9F7_9BACT|nr:NAD(P)-binding protein [Sulfurimonas marina]QOP40390.1 phytoene dehydrogenase [Sulfurimonas marina]
MFDFAVVGSGAGGSSIASLLSKKGYRVALFEKDTNLGGCSSSFKHKGYWYNTGATTLAGYEDGHVVKEVFDEIGLDPNLKESELSMEVIHKGKITKRYRELSKFVRELQKNYPSQKHEQFWNLVYRINQEFYQLKGYYYSNKNIIAKLFSLFSFLPFVIKFRKYLFISGEDFIKRCYGEVEQEYKEFLEAQVLIVAQAKLKEISFFTAAVALAYTFNKNHHVAGGFKKLFEDLTKNVESVFKNTQVLNIDKIGNYFELETAQEKFYAKKVILNSTVYQSDQLFSKKRYKEEFERYKKLDNHQGTFVVYITLKTDKKFDYHYQIIKEKCFTHAISNSVFISFSDDFKDGYVSITASTHTNYRIWYDQYQSKKEKLQGEIAQEIIQTFKLSKDEVVDLFSATPLTFKRYINREQVGGNPITMKNFLVKLPANDTHIEGLYQVGDTTFAAQGWPGVMMGVKNLARLLDV